MAYDHNHLAMWNQWNQEGGPNYPHQKVIQFVFRNFPPAVRSQTRVLDLGCGSGVHCVFLASEGFQVTGTDISEVGIANTSQKLSKLGLHANLKVEAADVLDFRSDSFDLVICVGVYDCAGSEVTKISVDKLSTLMAPGGRGIFLFASNNDFRFKHQVLNIHGFLEKEVKAIFANSFDKVWIDRYVTTYQGGQIEQNDWLVTVENLLP
ncbi:hypothetical protein DO97_04895 [Neosynechococcus sphagnicola sy1]|uniref:Methyltransferase domain-containing protein n=1 Tax=Neosynechococcus sphagnicola sy1 TaxID=1497020 RepID=A0A098TLQ9_9CYAN|nr:class I SAM-dependent methyltransferase [Neosynechococcus sphagnicola]KGF72807.1 hypothetical protein DO97_04895 [Neosynechococcus sphagnicola sy1]